VHNEARPFTVDAGGTRMIDLGTRFNVVRSSHGSEVAVAEGSVLFDPEGAAVRLGAGHMLRKREGSPIVEVSQADAQTVGGWRSGHLIYRDAPLWRVAEDLSRTTGVAIDLDPVLNDRPFTGAFAVRGMSPDSLRGRLGAILDVMVAQTAEGLYLRPRAAG
jgi:transmembrane sensor